MRPFVGRSAADLRRAQRAGPLPFRADLEAPSWLRRLVLRTLALAPADRWPSMQAVAKAFESGLAGLRRPLQRWALVLTPLGLLGGIAIGTVASESSQCDQADALDQAWDDDGRQRVARALGRSGRAFAADTARTVTRMLDEYAAAWSSSFHDACAQHRRGVESDTLFDRRRTCLLARQRAAVALIDLLAEADDATARHAVVAVDGLPRVRDCDGARLLDDTAWTLPEQPELRERHQALLDQLTLAQTHYRAARYREGIGLAEAALAQARMLQDEALLVRALLVRDGYQDRLGHIDEALADVEEAYGVALAAGNTVEAVRAAIRHVTLLGYEQRREDAARLRAADAERLVDRVARHNPELASELRPGLWRAEGLIELRAGNPVAAIERFERALQAVRALPASRGMEVASYLNSLAGAEFEAHRHEDALGHYREALALHEEVLGTEHPAVGNVHNNLGLLLRNMGRPEEGLAHLERALRIARDVFGVEHRDAMMAEQNLASVLHQLGEPARAVPLWEHVLGVAVDLSQAEAPTAHRAAAFARDLLAIGRDHDALEVLDEVLGFASRTGDGPLEAATQAHRAAALGRLGRLAEAQLARARAETLIAGRSGPDVEAVRKLLAEGGD